MEIEFIKVQKEDIKRLQECMWTCFGFTNSRDFISQKIEENKLWWIKVEGNIAGFFEIIDEGEALYISLFCILPEKRGNGIGSAALKKLVEVFGEGKSIVYAHPLLSAVDFYVKNGFSFKSIYDGGKIEYRVELFPK